MAPIVSILMPVYNPGKYLGKAVDSLLSQSFDNFELIAIDDGSTDGSQEYLEEVAKVDRRVRLLFLEHGGIVKALNRGLEEAKGEYIARMDADDVSLPRRLEMQVSALDKRPEVVAVGGSAIAIDPNGRPINRISPPLDHFDIVEKIVQGRGNAILHPAIMIRAEAIRKIGGYREVYRHIEDLDLYWHLSQIGKLANLEAVVLRYRQHPNSVNVLKGEMQRDLTQRWLRDVVHGGQMNKVESSFYRPGSIEQLYYDWSAKAFASGYQGTAFVSIVHSIYLKPLSFQKWKLLVRILVRIVVFWKKEKIKE